MLLNMSTDCWWEVQAQLLICAGNLLTLVDDAIAMGLQERLSEAAQEHVDLHDMASVLIEIVNAVFVPGVSTTNVLQAGLSALATHTDRIPGFATTYVNALVHQPQAMRIRILRPPKCEDKEEGYLQGNDPSTEEQFRIPYVMG